MKNIFKSFLLTLLGGMMMASCSGNTSTNKSTTNPTSETSKKTETGTITMKKESALVKGINQTVDLKDFFNFSGSYTIDDIKFSIPSYESHATLSGSTLTTKKLGEILVQCSIDFTKHPSVEGKINLKTIRLFVINTSDIANTFKISSLTDQSYNMTLKTNSDNSFSLTRPSGTCKEISNDPIAEATINGTYELKDDGIIYFTVDTASKEFAKDFTMECGYGDESKDIEDKENNDFYMYGNVPVSKDNLSLILVRFSSVKLG